MQNKLKKISGAPRVQDDEGSQKIQQQKLKSTRHDHSLNFLAEKFQLTFFADD